MTPPRPTPTTGLRWNPTSNAWLCSVSAWQMVTVTSPAFGCERRPQAFRRAPVLPAVRPIALPGVLVLAVPALLGFAPSGAVATIASRPALAIPLPQDRLHFGLA